jgi:hypothetical protein
MKWKKENIELSGGNGVRWEAMLYSTGNERCNNGVEIQNKWHYNGSGETAFGGAKQWPHIDLSISLCGGEEKLAEKIVDDLKKFVEVLANRNSLDKKRLRWKK